MMDFSRSKFNIIGKAKIWYTISIVIIALGLVGMVKNMVTDGFPLIRGIDFVGGSIIQLQFNDYSGDTAQFAHDVAQTVDQYTEKASQVLTTELTAEETGAGTPGLVLQIRADAGLIDNMNSQTGLFDEIRTLAGGKDFEILEETEVGAVIGAELAQKALLGVLVGLILILGYVTIRLSFDFAVVAVVALFHDVFILCGIFALAGIEINSPFVAILLTVVGYSINDTIVIYDRIRENMKVKRHLPFDRLVNQSLLETMARSINTSFTTLLAIMALLIFGGISLKTFMLGLGVGVLTGTYSSIFVASLLLVTWRLRSKGAVITHEKAASATDFIMDEDEDGLVDLSSMTSDGIEDEEVITIDEPPGPAAKPKPKKPKKRRRRH